MKQTEKKTIKFIAKSAREAADLVREQLGPEGRVISVRQVRGSGLQRFIAAPRLEIIAERNPSVAEVVGPGMTDSPSVEQVDLNGEGVASERVERVNRVASERSETCRGRGVSCRDLLAGAGFSAGLMARLEGAERWRAICALPSDEGLPQAVSWLRSYRAKAQTSSKLGRVAFIGSAGVGKTTSLCKYLAREVFLHGNSPEVLQLEVDKPHMDNGLAMYCGILGVPCYENPLEVESSEHLLIDVPGIDLAVPEEKKRLMSALDKIHVHHRVMVMNAAYESSILENCAKEGAALGAKYCVYTHLDELNDVGKLWGRVLDPKQATLFFADGQNVAGGLVEDTFGYLIERTFPR